MMQSSCFSVLVIISKCDSGYKEKWSAYMVYSINNKKSVSYSKSPEELLQGGFVRCKHPQQYYAYYIGITISMVVYIIYVRHTSWIEVRYVEP